MHHDPVHIFIHPFVSAPTPLRGLYSRLFCYLLLPHSLSSTLSLSSFLIPDAIMKVLGVVLMCAYFAGSMLLAIIALNSQQATRPALLIGIIGCACLSFRQITDVQFGLWGSQVFAMFIIIYVSHISCVLCYEKYVLPPKPGVSFQWFRAYRMLFNPRWLGTDRQSPHISGTVTRAPSLDTGSKYYREEYARDPAKRFKTMWRSPWAIFLRNRLLSFAGILILEKLYSAVYYDVAPRHGIQLGITDFLPTKESYFRRLGDVTLRETAIRAWLVMVFLFSSICVYVSIHDVLAFVFVATGFDNPTDWPPLFGDIREATSIRNFWGKFWHRLVYRSYTSYGIWISKNILCLPKSSLIGKIFINFFVYTLSGCVHMLAIRQLGYTCGSWGEVTFYLYTFLGVMVEITASAAFYRVTRGYQLNRTVSKVIGYTWVFMYLFTILPKSEYPKVFCNS